MSSSASASLSMASGPCLGVHRTQMPSRTHGLQRSMHMNLGHRGQPSSVRNKTETPVVSRRKAKYGTQLFELFPDGRVPQYDTDAHDVHRSGHATASWSTTSHVFFPQSSTNRDPLTGPLHAPPAPPRSDPAPAGPPPARSPSRRRCSGFQSPTTPRRRSRPATPAPPPSHRPRGPARPRGPRPPSSRSRGARPTTSRPPTWAGQGRRHLSPLPRACAPRRSGCARACAPGRRPRRPRRGSRRARARRPGPSGCW